MASFLVDGEFSNVCGESGILVDSRVGAGCSNLELLCRSSCTGATCYSNNPGCKIEETLLQVHFKYWNKLLGLMDN